MIALWQPLPRQITFRRKKYKLQLAFDNVLAALALLEDRDVLDSNKVSWALRLLAPRGCRLPIKDQQELLHQILQQCIFFSTRKSRGGHSKAFDWLFDADLIFASFRQAYGIDLREERGRMHWWKFYSLLQGLPNGTKLREVMEIRQRELPKPNGHNQKEIQQLLELKQYYAIPGAAGMDDYQTGLQKLWNTLERQAKQDV